MENPQDIINLAELLKPKGSNNSDSEDDLDQSQNNANVATPGDIGKKQPQKERKPSVYTKLPEPERKPIDVTELDNESEHKLFFEGEGANETLSDWRKTPHWDVSYKQQVTASDVFLQMSGKSPATQSCEDMIIKIHLPEENRHNIDLKILRKSIFMVSPKFKLDEPLPHPVDPKLGNAQWDNDSETLIVTLRMDREFDYLNF